MSNTPCTTVYNPLAPRAIVLSGIQWNTLTPVAEPLGDTAEAIRAAVAMKALQRQDSTPGPTEFIQDHLHDHHPDTFPGWLMLEELWDEIVALPCSAMIMRELLYGEEYFRIHYAAWSGLNPELDIVWKQIYAMIARITAAVRRELAAYEAVDEEIRLAKIEIRRRELKLKQKSSDEDVALLMGARNRLAELQKTSLRGKRPADIYRRFGLALRYAVEELGSFDAKDALNTLTLSVTIPVVELENPEWVDGFTGETDPEYEFIRVRELPAEEVSNDGNLPATLADLLENLDSEGKTAFSATLERLGMNVDDYWRQFMEAQRSGYSLAVETIEIVEEDDGYDGEEKDFEYKADLQVSHKDVEAIQDRKLYNDFRVSDALLQVKKLMETTAKEVALVRETDILRRKIWEIVRSEKHDLDRKAVKSVSVLLQNLFMEIESLIPLIQSRMEREFPEGRAEIDARLQYLPFRYPVRVDRTVLGKLLDLAGKKIKDLFAITWDIARARFLTNTWVGWIVHRFSEWGQGRVYEPKDLLAVLLPYQNAFGFREDEPDDDALDPVYDLALFKIPTEWGGTLHGFILNHGEAYFEQFTTGGGAGIRPSRDPNASELEQWTNDVMEDRVRVYLSRKGAREWRRVFRSTKGEVDERKAAADAAFQAIYEAELQENLKRLENFGLKPNNRNNPEFLEAEVIASLMTDGSPSAIKQACWDAYRENIDTEANMEFKRVFHIETSRGVPFDQANLKAMAAFWEKAKANKAAGTTKKGETSSSTIAGLKLVNARATAAFWERVNASKDRITGINRKGLVLASGRPIDWGIARLKLEKGEIPDTIERLAELHARLVELGYGGWFTGWLKSFIDRRKAVEDKIAVVAANVE